MVRVLSFFLLIIFIQACSQTSNGRYSIAQDHAPTREPTTAETVNPTPRFEPYSRQGNAPYSLFGEHYEIVEDVSNYRETGIASWYGQKFHGHLTSNGEYFNMFSMSAAHKTLPLPSYVRVRNLDNGREAVVRVNDRGPFHSGRIIDLSYAAAYRLGVSDTGTANVEIEVLQPELEDIATTQASDSNPVEDVEESGVNHEDLVGLFIQVAATQIRKNAENAASELEKNYNITATIFETDGLHKLIAGPFAELEAARWLTRLRDDGFHGAFRVEFSAKNNQQSFSENSEALD